MLSHSVMSDSWPPQGCVVHPGSSVHAISQARVLEWVAISLSRGSSHPRIEPRSPALAGRFFTTEPPEKPHKGISALIMRDRRELVFLSLSLPFKETRNRPLTRT